MSADEAVIADLIRDVYARFAAGDPVGQALTDAPDFTIWDVWTPELIVGEAGRAAFRAADHAQAARRGPLTIAVEPPRVTVWDTAAVACYYLTFTYQPPNAARGRIRATTVLRKIDGQWRRVHHHESLVPVGPPPLDD
ncbi:MAG: nuclear transport factor 2 family protein [Dehalococcoidia bacterium]|nr:nuclear transport factor 2 family protein [Dehalococcoidia bacterium]